MSLMDYHPEILRTVIKFIIIKIEIKLKNEEGISYETKVNDRKKKK